MTESDKNRASEVLRALTWTAAATHDLAELLIASTGQTLARWLLLDVIAADPSTVPSAARRLGRTRQSTQRIADLLHAENLLEKRDNPDHRTSPLYALTEQGSAALRRMDASVEPWLEYVGTQLSQPEHELLLGQLEALRGSATAYRQSLGH